PATGASRPALTLGGTPSDGATLIDLRISVDDRTNSILVAGSRNDLDVIEAVISRLEDAEVQSRQNMVYRLRNAAAADVATAPLPSSQLAEQATVGFQGLGNLGVGRSSPTSGIGGLVFSAQSNSFNLLIRALKTQGRLDVLSRPQVMTLDNQTAAVNIGQEFP